MEEVIGSIPIRSTKQTLMAHFRIVSSSRQAGEVIGPPSRDQWLTFTCFKAKARRSFTLAARNECLVALPSISVDKQLRRAGEVHGHSSMRKNLGRCQTRDAVSGS